MLPTPEGEQAEEEGTSGFHDIERICSPWSHCWKVDLRWRLEVTMCDDHWVWVPLDLRGEAEMDSLGYRTGRIFLVLPPAVCSVVLGQIANSGFPDPLNVINTYMSGNGL